MAIEIERKFLLKDDSWRSAVSSRAFYKQSYARFVEHPRATFRVRIVGEKGFLSLKGPVSGCSRCEFEYGIPLADAEAILEDFCSGSRVEKYRNIVYYAGNRWEIDEFEGDNRGLIVAELELRTPDQAFERPPWLGPEVTGEFRYFNSSLLRNPYKNWKKES
ncbi:MAG: CYTH domain protein [Lentisphaerae bacterium ADurb.Bin242]|nr:MAG: CYTH domain protein [Lentisphaerae bacterium ADurb.Bin242]